MNFTVHSTKPLDVKVFMTFIDQTTFEFQVRLSGKGPCQYCVIGRSPQELVHMELQYNDMRFAHPIEAEGTDLKAIHIYGNRDIWSQLLRETAMKSAEKGTTPEDYD